MVVSCVDSVEAIARRPQLTEKRSDGIGGSREVWRMLINPGWLQDVSKLGHCSEIEGTEEH